MFVTRTAADTHQLSSPAAGDRRGRWRACARSGERGGPPSRQRAGWGSGRPESGPNSPLIKIICGGKVPLDAVERGWGQQVAAWGVHLRS